MTPEPPRQAGSLSQTVYDRLHGRIASGDLAPGDLLPKEDLLAADMGVSRTVLREALAQLRHEGIIESKRGTGSRVIGLTRVGTPPIFAPAPPTSIADLQSCYEFRLGIEPCIAALAAERAGPEDLAALETTMHAFETAALAGELAANEDIAFHTALTRAARNSFYDRTIAAIAVPVEVGMQIARSFTGGRPVDRMSTTIAEHRAIVDAIRARDPQAARDAMCRHIEASMQRVFVGPQA